MILNFDTITLSFLVVAAVTLAVVSVLVWYVYSSKKFRQDIIDLMDNKLEMYLDNLEPPVQEAEEETEPTEQKETAEEPATEKTKDECEFAEKKEEPQSFVEKDFVEKDL